MRIDSIAIQNFIGLRDFRHQLSSPFLFVTGPNGAGKSSLQDALRFALLGEPARGVTKVGDRPQLITEGAAAGYAQVVVDGYEIRRNIGSGKVSGDAPTLPDGLALCLDAPRFATMDDAQRRRMLFELAKVRVDRQGVADQLTASGVEADIIERVLPLLREGFPAAASFAKEQAAQARGAWRAITGEAYGSVKAESWTAQLPENTPKPSEIEETKDLVSAAEQRVQFMLEAKGRVSAAMSATRRAELEEESSRVDALTDSVKRADAALDAAQRARDALETGQAGEPHTCPACEAKLILAQGELHVATKTKAATKAQINGADQMLAAARRDRDTALSALRSAQGAEATLANLPPPPSDEDVSSATMLAQEQENLRLYRRTLESLESAQHLLEAALGKADLAKSEHRRAVAWTEAEAQLGPDGIPATLLSQALDPINDQLANQAARAEFRPARVERDLSLTYAGRPYALCSESEKWRADALFAVVVAMLSDCRIVALDRFDVLDPESRAAAIEWLESLVFSPDESRYGELASVIVTATLKQKPDLGERIDVVWLEGKAALQEAA